MANARSLLELIKCLVEKRANVSHQHRFSVMLLSKAMTTKLRSRSVINHL